MNKFLEFVKFSVYLGIAFGAVALGTAVVTTELLKEFG